MKFLICLAGVAVLLESPATAIPVYPLASEATSPGDIGAQALQKASKLAAREGDAVVTSYIDISLVEAAATPPSNIDVSQDYPIHDYNFLQNTAWTIASRDHLPVWVHESRLLAPNTTTKNASVHRRSSADYWLAGASSSKRSCPPRNDLLGPNRCHTYSLDSAKDKLADCNDPIKQKACDCKNAVFGEDLTVKSHINTSNNDHYPKVNIYKDNNCNEYWFSMTTDGGCVYLAPQNLDHFSRDHGGRKAMREIEEIWLQYDNVSAGDSGKGGVKQVILGTAKDALISIHQAGTSV
ncbi:hypothetical protein IFM46972_00992 [Aspergillus udagawae]|uniref:Uncharacterized protein n=1 Tax=Aspergillus udagawae TaxID=91492 RepID=A0A8H3N5X3_9EURO|nr:hypothetical protein IFM46972_00992 [Aspergillus udagawae]